MFKNGARYNAIGPWLREYFGDRTIKLSIDGGFTCPNRDGTLSYDGCSFCSRSGSGDFTSGRLLSITEQMKLQSDISSQKWLSDHFIAYFQNYTNTYANISDLRSKYYEALSFPGCCGIAIATRPDCLRDEVIDLLSEINNNTFLWVELGLQTSNDKTAELINRCCPTSFYDKAVEKLLSVGIRIVTHVIFGLPGETHNEMMQTVHHVCKSNIFGIKVHLLHIMSGTALGDEYIHQQRCGLAAPDITDYTFPQIIPMEKSNYIATVADALEIIPPDVTIHRLTGDAPCDSLLAPLWSLDKKSVLNGINMELKKRGTMQGFRRL